MWYMATIHLLQVTTVSRVTAALYRVINNYRAIGLHIKYSEEAIHIIIFYSELDVNAMLILKPLTAKLFNFTHLKLCFHPLQVIENYSDLTKCRSTLFKSFYL